MKFKLIYLSILLIFVVSILNGCANATYKINLKNDGRMDIKLTVIFSENNQDKVDFSKIEAIKQKFDENGYSVEMVTDKGLNGFEFVKKDIKYDYFNKEENKIYIIDILDDIVKGMTFNQGFFNNKYSVNSTINLNELLNKTEVESITGCDISIPDDEYKKYLSQLNLKLIISVDEGSVISTNSNLISDDKKSVEWVLIPGNTNQITLDAMSGFNKATVSTYLIIGIILILSVILIIILIRRFRKRKD